VDPSEGVTKECWCEQLAPAAARGGHGTGSHGHSRVAVVMLSRHPPDLRLWLEYHLGYMGIEHVFMQVEDTPEFNSTWQALHPSRQRQVTVWRAPSVSGPDKRPADDYETLQHRQTKAMRLAKEASVNMGIQWLVHIDDDELLYAPIHRPVGDILAAMPGGFDQVYIPNSEAIYPSADVQNCFAQTTEININAFKFVSYANGKAAVRVSDSAAVPAGPHQWRDLQGRELPSIHLDAQPFGAPLMVVHFESCPFSRWEDKYWELGNTPAWKVNRIPFRFYRESIEKMQNCRAGGSDPECSDEALRSFWASWKTEANSDLRRQDLMPIRIPWPQIAVTAAER